MMWAHTGTVYPEKYGAEYGTCDPCPRGDLTLSLPCD
jgi:hypothetical protein